VLRDADVRVLVTEMRGLRQDVPGLADAIRLDPGAVDDLRRRVATLEAKAS
jgi:hypothetical protein